MVRCLTDNRNRTVAELRNIFTKTGGNLGETGCVGWMFDAKGLITLPAGAADEETIMMATMDAGAEDIRMEEESIEILCPPEDLAKVRDAVTAAGLTYTDSDLTMIPQNTIRIEDANDAKKILRLIDMLEDNDDVQTTYSNSDIPDEILQQVDL